MSQDEIDELGRVFGDDEPAATADTNPVSTWSLKRLAWAYGCTRDGKTSAALLEELRRRFAQGGS